MLLESFTVAPKRDAISWLVFCWSKELIAINTTQTEQLLNVKWSKMGGWKTIYKSWSQQ